MFDDFQNGRDRVWMAEVERETKRPSAHQKRIAFFFSAMRHFRDELEEAGRQVVYTELPEDPGDDRGCDLGEVLAADVRALAPERLVVTQPGDHRVLVALQHTAEALGVELEVRPDRHFYGGLDEFAEWADGRKELVLEHFYRRLRKVHGVLLDGDGKPEGGRWNFDADNRETFGKGGPGDLPALPRDPPDAVTKAVLELVAARFADHPGELEPFELPVTRTAARAHLDDFVAHRLPLFGRYEDALWEGARFLYHSRLSMLLNVKLLDPRTCVDAAVDAYREGRAPIAAVEGFTRQILGWREFVRGVYWTYMPEYAERNALECEDRDVPSFFWDGDTDMRCVADAMSNVVENGYAHHIQRLMVLGLFAQMLGVHPLRFHEWHVAMYLDSVDWASLPNALGMSQYGDGGVVGTKPYCATGRYVDRMSNHCRSCRYDPKAATGETACPFTTLYWDFLVEHRERFAGNRRMTFQLKNVERKKPSELGGIRSAAAALRARIDGNDRV